jgi:hypothetical protein
MLMSSLNNTVNGVSTYLKPMCIKDTGTKS